LATVPAARDFLCNTAFVAGFSNLSGTATKCLHRSYK
jgi:hypothetical protein